MNSNWKIMAAAFVSAAAFVTLDASPAEACGGFFCDNNQPVNQAAERIIFSDNPDGTVTAVVQILYDGPSERFAWVLPVPSVPEVGVSSDVAFQRLQTATNPQYTMTTRVEGQCDTIDSNGVFFDSAAEAGNNSNNLNNANGGVSVLDGGSVGPYDYTVIEVDNTLADPEQAALTWLEENSYDVTALGGNVIAPYLEEGMLLIAFRLTKNSGSGDIRPVTLNYETDTPMIPIKLTAVAANEDMGVMTWVLGDHRAVPVNYKSLVLNEALINWFNPNSNYNDVVSAAADEAEGQGFATEMAGDSSTLDEVVWSQRDAQNWERFQNVAARNNMSSTVCEAWSMYGGGDFQGVWDGWPETINEFFSGMTPQERDRIISNGCGSNNVPGEGDPQAFVNLVEANIILPMVETQKILSGAPYFTRMYTTMSAAEMTVDPVFDFNPDLSDFSNQHTVERVIECSEDYLQSEAPWRVRLENGMLVRGFGRSWPIAAGDVPATQFVQQDSTSGDAEVVIDNTRTISLALEANNDRVLSEVDNGCGCATADGRFPTELFLIAFGLFALRLRSRRD